MVFQDTPKTRRYEEQNRTLSDCSPRNRTGDRGFYRFKMFKIFKCLLWSFGTRQKDGGATFRVSYASVCMYVHAYECMYEHLYACMCIYMYVYTCLRIYMLVYACICIYVHVYVCMCMYVIIGFALSVASFQSALLNTHSSLLQVASPWHLRRESKVFTWLLVCFGLTQQRGKQNSPHLVSQGQQIFIQGAKETFPYTPLYWAIFFKIINCFGSYKNVIMEVSLHVISCICMYMIVYACI